MARTTAPAKAQDSTRADALLLFKLIHDQSIPAAARNSLLEHADDVTNVAPVTDTRNNKSLFLRGYVQGWPLADKHTRRTMREILRRVKRGESLKSVFDDFSAQARKIAEENRAAQNGPRKIQVQVLPTERRFEVFGILGGDVVNSEEVKKLWRGDVVTIDLSGSMRLAWYVGAVKDKSGAWHEVEFYDGKVCRIAKQAKLYRVVSVDRTVPVKPRGTVEKTAEISAATRARIAELKRRAETLYEPENERAYFKTMAEIYQLEHEGAADEWPEVLQ